MKLIFFSDLDNTLIYSFRHVLPEEKLIVEYKDGKELSSMTEKTFCFLKQIQSDKEILFVPLTTRTSEQYQRIDVFQKELYCRYALACNGAVLLENGQINNSWKQESLNIAGNQLDEVERVYKKMASLFEKAHLHMAEGFFSYGISEAPEKCYEILNEYADREKVDIVCSSRKVYCIPKAFSKGNAAVRFRRKFPQAAAVGAGDSVIDISMLNACDKAYGSYGMLEFVPECKVIPPHGEFELKDFLINMGVNEEVK